MTPNQPTTTEDARQDEGVGPAIREVDIYNMPDGLHFYKVDLNGVTRIESFTKPGMYSDIPYIRIWKGEHCEAEFCQHNIVGVYFDQVHS